MIESAFGQTIDQILKIGIKFGELPKDALLSLLVLWLGWDKYKKDNETQELRTSQAIAENKTADALAKMVDELEEFRIIISERLPHR
jgi:hypothetical protein